MCGIIGIISGSKTRGLAYKEREDNVSTFVEEMLYMDALRGPHATGLFRVNQANEDKPATVWKRALHAADFLQLNQTAMFMKDTGMARVVVGHNRWATQGGTAPDNNAHPFQVGPVTLVHNGHITNQWQLADHREFTHQVDSAYIAYALAKEENDARNVLSRLKGAYALVWHDARTGCLHMARNKDRPLYWAHLGKDKDHWPGIVFASEYEMMASVLRRNAIDVHGEFRYPKEFNLVSWDLEEPGEFDMQVYEESREVSSSAPFLESKKEPTGGGDSSPKPTGTRRTTGTTPTKDDNLTRQERKWKKRIEKDTPFKFREWCAVAFTEWELYKNQRSYGVCRGTISRGGKEFKVEVPNVEREEWFDIKSAGGNSPCRLLNVRNSKKGVRTITAEFLGTRHEEEKGKIRTFISGPGGRLVEQEVWDTLVSKGCSNCSQPLYADDPRTIVWMGEQQDSPVCEECSIDLLGERRGRHAALN